MQSLKSEKDLNRNTEESPYILLEGEKELPNNIHCFTLFLLPNYLCVDKYIEKIC